MSETHLLGRLAVLTPLETLALTRFIFRDDVEEGYRFAHFLRNHLKSRHVQKFLSRFDRESQDVLLSSKRPVTVTPWPAGEVETRVSKVLKRAQTDAKNLAQLREQSLPVVQAHREGMKSVQPDAPFDSYLGIEAPPAFKRPETVLSRIKLSRPSLKALKAKNLVDCIRDRRSNREINALAIAKKDLNLLLWATSGIAEIHDNGKSHLRNVPSGGSRHAFDTYLFINRVKGMAPGLYFYDPTEHELLALKLGDLSRELRPAVNGQGHLYQAAIYVVWAATPYRSEWRYGLYARKDMLIECGHICQNLYLMAEALELGVCAASGYHQSELDRLMGLDGRDEFAVYSASISARS